MQTPTTDRKLLVLFDGSAVFHRGYHAIPHLSTADGTPTNAILGFANIALKVLNDLKPDYAVVTWDKSSQTFRKDMYPQYKATRSRQPDDLYAQIPATHEFVDALGLPWVELDNFEADDIIGTLAAQAEKLGGIDVVIATGDRDQLQLISPTTVVDMFNPRGMEPTRYDLAKMTEKYNMSPAQFIDYKAIVGDTSDNIPGVAGIGDVGARKLMGAYGSLDAIYDHIDEVVGKTKDHLVRDKEIAYLSQKLSRIVCDAPVTLELENAEVGDFDEEVLTSFFRKYEMKSLLYKLPSYKMNKQTPSATEQSNKDITRPTLFDDDDNLDNSETPDTVSRPHLNSASYRLVSTQTQLEELTSILSHQSAFAFDTETTSVDVHEAKLVGLSFSFKDSEAYYIPVGHIEGEQLNLDHVIDRLRPIFANEQIPKSGHNIKYDVEILSKYDVYVANITFDTMIAAFVLNPLGRSQSLDDLAFQELNINMIPIKELIGVGKSQLSFDQTSINDAVIYACEDADISWRLTRVLQERLNGTELNDLLTVTEWPLIPVLVKMELAGIKLDTTLLATFGKRLELRISELKALIYDLAGQEFNIGSPMQMSQILYGQLDLPTAGLKRGKTGYSTAAGELEKLRHLHPIIEHIMQYREYDKLKNTYVDALPELVKKDGRIHTSFNQTIAQTGRLSSTNPNLQNIPVRTELGREIRTSFIVEPGFKLIGADYSQIELRVAAALADDDKMIATFRQGIDLHQQTAAELFDVPLDNVTKEQRYNAKTINFGVLYGMSAHGLSIATGMDQKEASEFIKRYFEVRPSLKSYIERTKRFAYDNLYTATMFGRRRPCPEIRSSNFQIRQGAERMAVNVPIQGTAADIYKLAMISLAGKLDSDCRLLLQIHDELIVEAPTDKAEMVSQLMRDTMVNVYDIGVPLAVDTAIGDNWGQL